MAPKDQELGVAGASASPGPTKMVARAGAAQPFAAAAGLLTKLAGIQLPAKRVERAAEAGGAAAAAVIEAQARNRVAAMDEVAELRRMFGIPDYLIRVQVADLSSYERWLTTQLLGDPAIARVDSRITMKLVKLQR